MGAATINDTGEQLIGHVNEALGQSVATTSDTGETLIGHVNDAIGVAGTATVNDTGEVFIGHVNDALDHHAGPKTIRVMTFNVARFTVDASSDNEQTDSYGYYTRGIIQNPSTYTERYNAWTGLLNGVDPHVLVTVEHRDNFAAVNGEQKAANTILQPWGAQFTSSSNNANLTKGIFSKLGAFSTKNAYIFAIDQGTSTRRNYIIADVVVGGVTVRFAVAHLTFSRSNDINGDRNKRYSEMDELMSACASVDHAVILGDFNILNADEYQRFVQAGYSCANNGTLPTYNGDLVINWGSRALDNIIVKGFTISNVTVPDASVYHDINGEATKYPLSDHNPIWCDLTFV